MAEWNDVPISNAQYKNATCIIDGPAPARNKYVEVFYDHFAQDFYKIMEYFGVPKYKCLV